MRQLQQRRTNECLESPTDWASRSTTIATCVIALVGILQWNILSRQLNEMECQTRLVHETLVTSERPWLYLVDNTLPRFESAGDKNDSFSISISNYGNSLARDVQVGGKVVALEEMGAFQQGIRKEDIPCKNPAGAVNFKTRIRGIPPHDKAENIPFFVMSGAALERANPHNVSRQYFAGCISYRWHSTDETFHTYFLIPATIINRNTGQAQASNMAVDPTALDFRLNPDISVTYVDLD